MPQIINQKEGRDGQDPSRAIDDRANRLVEEDDAVAGDKTGDMKVKGKLFHKRPVFLLLASVALIIGAIIGLRYWFYSRSHESTDDAFIDGHLIQVSPKVSGYVLKVYVKGNQEIKEGDLIAELDARDYETRLEQAKAALETGLMHLKEARVGVDLTRANSEAKVQQASAIVGQARSSVESSRAAAAAERTRITQTGAGVTKAQANLSQTRSLFTAAEAELTRANADVARYQTLFAKDEISRQRLDQAIAAARTASAQLDFARGKVAAAEAQVDEARAAEVTAVEDARQAQTQIGGTQAGVNEAMGRLAQANTAPQQVAVSQARAETASVSIEQLHAAVVQAQLELSYTKIYAPATGRVTRKTVEEGVLVREGEPLMTIIPGEVWVTANFKENQIGKIRPGQSVEIKVDAYPNKIFKGHVDSIQAGTGARFSLLPAENAAGNYVKVVQRIPVKIVFDESPDMQHMLAPGMSVEPEVKVK
jgi:membrane fusion protein (multidrug efflux system)